MTDTMQTRPVTVATWKDATEGRRDTNPFDFIETTLRPHCERVGIYDVVRRYSDEVADALPEHIEFVDNRFVTAEPRDEAADRAAIAAAIQEADERHRRLVEEWIR
ncbi:hypothetical protein [Mobilicoccus pelagius]|uniref:Uncharacterized protein n=1 Tax=Mobilicoccus pelagius NBRC 104925 TaxID=1089455 RepID=H5UPM0_9MICO|nr:hypothetical protein [Mobilicoccus pelagius]GAB47678.1 hypothetical protein MOPEL_023_00180 [Mobilicoccus pelagius NBRC 104925]